MQERLSFYSSEEKQKIKKSIHNKLKNIFKDIEKSKYKVVEDLIEQVSFMGAELKDLSEIIKRDGSIEEYQNGKWQKGIKLSAATQAHSTIIKNYNTSLKQLTELLKTDDKDTDDGFDEFLKTK